MQKNRNCDRCSKPAKVFLPYGPHWLCREHFNSFFEHRFRKTIRKYKLFRGKEKLLVAVSGGKDSLTALYLLKKFYSKTNKIQALLIDEGIKGYRDKALAIAKKNCKKWRVPFKVVSFRKEFGVTMLGIMRKTTAKKLLGSTCAFCGTLRRRLMNSYAKKLKADKLVTGHNLDDEVQSICMNIFDNDLKRFARLGAVSALKGEKLFVPRIKPLIESPEKEVIAYAGFQGIRHSSEDCCPFKWQAKRNAFRKMLEEIEEKFPGTRYSILRFFEKVKPLIPKEGKAGLGNCLSCGEASSEKSCSVCLQLGKLARIKV